MPEHMKDTVTHLTLLANVTLSLVKENQELKEIVGKKNQQIDEMAQEVHEFRQKMAETDEMAQEVQKLKTSVQELTFHKVGLPISFRVEQDVEEHVCLPPFYTHSHGYKFCVNVYPQGNGDGKGTHVSVYTYLMKGPFDDHLKWPFRVEITIQIVNQDGDHDHVERTVHYNDEIPDANAGRVTGNKNRASGRGYPQFLAHAHLGYNRARKTQYGKDGVVIVRVVKVTLL